MSRTQYGLYSILVFLVAALFATPLYTMLITALKTSWQIRNASSVLTLPDSLEWKNLVEAFQSACIGTQCFGLKKYFFNSLAFAIPASIFSTLIGAFNGFFLAQYKMRGQHIIFFLLTLSLFIPPQSILIPLSLFFGRSGLNSTQVLFIVHSFLGVAVTTLLFRNYYLNFPKEIIYAAYLDGSSLRKTWWHILFPLSKGMLMVGFIWQFTHIYNDYILGAVLSVGQDRPVTVALNNLVFTSTGTKNYHIDMAATLIQAAPTLLIYFFMGGTLERGLLSSASKS